MAKLFEQISTKTPPTEWGWYNTDKGELYFFKDDKEWSCRQDKISHEYPKFWYSEVKEPCKHESTYYVAGVFGGNYCNDCQALVNSNWE